MVSTPSTSHRDAVLFNGRAGSDARPVPVGRNAPTLPCRRRRTGWSLGRRVGSAWPERRAQLVAQAQGVLDQPDHAAGMTVLDEPVSYVHVERPGSNCRSSGCRRRPLGNRPARGAASDAVPPVRDPPARRSSVSKVPGIATTPGGRSPRSQPKRTLPPRRRRGRNRENVISLVAVPIVGSRPIPRVVCERTPTIVAATGTRRARAPAICWRHSRRNSRHAHRKMARRAGPPPLPAASTSTGSAGRSSSARLKTLLPARGATRARPAAWFDPRRVRL